MITVFLDRDRYAYDVHSLVKAFYPAEEVSCRTEERMPDHTGPCTEGLSLEFTIREEEGYIGIRLRTSDGAEKTRTAACIPAGPGQRANSIDLHPQTDEKGERLYNGKNTLKRLLYEMLREETGRDLPWGSLTGIRPTHIPGVLLENGWEDARILAELQDTFYVSLPKAALSLDIAKRERGILASKDYGRGYSLYVGIPFCPTTCLYCSFPSYPLEKWSHFTDDYLAALMREMRETAAIFAGRCLHTVYFGGGTPTTLSPKQLDLLLSALEEYFDLSDVEELTVEAGRPDSLDEEKLKVLREHKVTRLSVNPQTMQQRTLDLIGRRHTVEDVKQAFHLVRKCGDFSINMDLILGLPGETADDVADTLSQIAALGPDDLTIHALAYKRGSRMQALAETKGTVFSAFENIERAASIAAETTAAMGLLPYYLYRQKNIAGNFENTGYAKDGAWGLYNILINEDVHSVAALGAGAISKCVDGDLVTRAENVKDLMQYIQRIDEMIDRKKKLYEEHVG